uniref:Uncharacterized protein n=1 Tax=Anguilla anguilla TaxID=7936 RepID=A0A0E9R5C5_ANGAN
MSYLNHPLTLVHTHTVSCSLNQEVFYFDRCNMTLTCT